MGHKTNIETYKGSAGAFYWNKFGADIIVSTETRRYMKFSTPPKYYPRSIEARAGVIDHTDIIVLLFVLSSVIVAFTVIMMN